MFNLINLLAITAEGQAPYVSPEELAEQAKNVQDKKIWLVILIVLLAAEIIFAVIYPKIKARRAAEKEKRARRHKHSKK